MKKMTQNGELVSLDETVQAHMNVADELRKQGKHNEATKHYLVTLDLLQIDRGNGVRDTTWGKKVIFMACNGMGICYSRLGKPIDAVENFVDAIEYAPNQEARQVALGNLKQYQEAYTNATGGRIIPL